MYNSYMECTHKGVEMNEHVLGFTGYGLWKLLVVPPQWRTREILNSNR